MHRTQPPPGPSVTVETTYWDDYVRGSADDLAHQAAWLRFSRRLYSSWIRTHLSPRGPQSVVLKTDSFEEVRGTEVAGCLAGHFGSTVVIDIAISALQRARCHLDPTVGLVVSAAQSMPFRHASFDAVISLSTLDHLSPGR